jgi:pimeloyl-ACP methyl ester carboxylesterase
MDFGETRYAHAGEVDIAYRVFGDGQMNLVIVPGIFSHLDLFFTFDLFCDFMERFAAFGRVVTFDKRGTGLSDPTPGAAELDERMDDIRAVMDATGMEHAAVIGISEGGSLALLFAATYPERTDAVVVCGSFGHVPPGSALRALLEHGVEEWGTGRVSIELSPGLRKSSPLVRRSLGFLERASASPHMGRSIADFVLSLDIRPILSSIQAPMLAVHRADEVIDVSYARDLAEGVPDGRLVVLDGDDHLPWVGNATEYVDAIEEFLTGTKHEVEPERGLSTVLFTDIVSSTSRNAELGDDAWRRLLDRHNNLVREALADYRGREIKTVGDGFLSTFDGPARALRCARAIVDGVGDLGLSVRAGLHTGEVEMYPDGDIGGMAVNLGARVGAAAEGGEVLVSSTIKDLVFGSGFRFVSRGVHELKGVPGTWPLFALEGEGSKDVPAVAAVDHLGPLDRARVRLAHRSPRASRAITRLIMRGADDSFTST